MRKIMYALESVTAEMLQPAEESFKFNVNTSIQESRKHVKHRL